MVGAKVAQQVTQINHDDGQEVVVAVLLTQLIGLHKVLIGTDVVKIEIPVDTPHVVEGPNVQFPTLGVLAIRTIDHGIETSQRVFCLVAFERVTSAGHQLLKTKPIQRAVAGNGGMDMHRSQQ